MTAYAIPVKDFHPRFNKSDWPKGVLTKMNADVLVNGVFPLRDLSGIPMWPSSLYGAHIRTTGNSRHSTKNGTRLADATDMHVETIEQMVAVSKWADSIDAIGGIGIYFDTNTPLIHIDMRDGRLMWLRDHKGKYIYRENNVELFNKILRDEIKLKGVVI